MRTASSILGMAITLGVGWPALDANAVVETSGASLRITQSESAKPVVRGAKRESVINETFTAAPGETLEIVFADGSSLTLASGASVTVERFNYDGATRLGELVVRVQSGVVRIAGGALNNTSLIRVITPQGEAQIDNGIAYVDVSGGSSEIGLLLGKHLTVNANGRSAAINNAGSMFRLTGTGIEGPNAISHNRDQNVLAALNPGLFSGVVPQFIEDESSEEKDTDDSVLTALNTVKDEKSEGAATESNDSNTGGDGNGGGGDTGGGDTGGGDTGGNDGGGNTGPTLDFPASLTANVAEGCSGCELNGLNWSSTSTPIDTLGNAGGDIGTDYWDWLLSSDASAATTSTVYGGARSFTMDTANGTPLSGASFTYGSTSSCNPCTYVFAQEIRTDDSASGNLGRYSLQSNWLLIVDSNESSGNERAFGVNLGDEAERLPASGELSFTDSGFGGGTVFRSTLNPFVSAADQYVLQSGFESKIVNVKYAGAQNQSGGCVDGQISGGSNGGCYVISGRLSSDPNPCGDNPECTQAAIAIASTQESGRSSVFADEFNNATLFTFADGTVRVNGQYVYYTNGRYDLGEEFEDSEVDGQSGQYDDGENFIDKTEGEQVLVDSTTLPIVFKDSGNNFLLFEARAVEETGGTEEEPVTLPDDRKFLFATGNVSRSGDAKAASTLDRFLISAGVGEFGGEEANSTYQSALDACAEAGESCEAPSRAFLREDTVPDELSGSLYDSGLLVLNPADSDTSAVFHVDFGLTGTGASQVSTVSALFGALNYNDSGSSASIRDATLVASTYGPGRALDENGTASDSSVGMTAISALLVSTAVGGGNDRLTAAEGNTRAGYIVLETGQYEDGGTSPCFDAACVGTEHPVTSTDDDVQFASLRLASGAASISLGERKNNDSGGDPLKGYLAGLQQAGAGDISALSELDTNNQAAANFSLTTTMDGDNANLVSADSGSLHLGYSADGNKNGNSAYINEENYGAASQDGKSAIVSAQSVLPGWQDDAAGMDIDRDPTNATEADMRTTVTSYKYLQWGFFFGATAPDNTATAGVDESKYAHLASWVAGKLSDPDGAKPKGSAVYEGHVIGNVAAVAGSTTSLYTAIGTFKNDWNFDVRQGSVEMNFDGAKYEGKTNFVGDTLNTAKTAFEGSNNANFYGTIHGDIGNRQGALNGSFIDDPTDATNTHVGEVGRFDIVGTANGAVNYVASGTFAAEKP